jgi:hypothetical protein
MVRACSASRSRPRPSRSIVARFDRQAGVVGQGRLVGPLPDADEGLGRKQPVGDEDLDAGAPGDVTRPGEVPIAGGGAVKWLEVRDEDGEGPDDRGIEPNGGVDGRSLPG